MIKKNRSSIPQYSYRQSIKKEDVKVYRKIALIITGFFVVIIVVWFMGTSFLNALSLLSNGNNQSSSNGQSDQTLPLLAPAITKLPDSTNQNQIKVEGSTTSQVDVTLYVNSIKINKIKADTSGNFSFANVKLTDGLNLIKVVATDKTGENQESTTTITLDKIKPSLVVNTPIDGANFPATNTTTPVSGTTETTAIVHVNGSQAIVDSTGKFSYNLTVQAGANPIEVNSTDAAGNITTVKLNITVDSSVPTYTGQ